MPSGASGTGDDVLRAHVVTLCDDCLLETMRAVDAAEKKAKARVARAEKRYRAWLAAERRVEGASWEPLMCAARARELWRARAAASEAWRQRLALYQSKGILEARWQLLAEQNEERRQERLF